MSAAATLINVAWLQHRVPRKAAWCRVTWTRAARSAHRAAEDHGRRTWQGVAGGALGVVFAPQRHIAHQIARRHGGPVQHQAARAAPLCLGLLLARRGGGVVILRRRRGGGRSADRLRRAGEVREGACRRFEIEALVVLLAAGLRLVATHVLRDRAPVAKAILKDALEQAHLLVGRPVFHEEGLSRGSRIDDAHIVCRPQLTLHFHAHGEAMGAERGVGSVRIDVTKVRLAAHRPPAVRAVETARLEGRLLTRAAALRSVRHGREAQHAARTVSVGGVFNKKLRSYDILRVPTPDRSLSGTRW